MNLLIIIGNAAVDYKFRGLLLKDPVGVAEKYGLRLTKFEVEMLKMAFTKNTLELNKSFKGLEAQLYANIGVPPTKRKSRLLAMPVPNVPIPCTKKPCSWSLNVPSVLQDDYDKVEEAA